MQVMVMYDDPAVQVRVAKGLRVQGFQVTGMETVARACEYVKHDPVDLLIMGERVAGRLSHTVALAAECANPMVSTIILTERRDREVEELYELLPSLYALMGPLNAPAMIATVALAAIANPEDAEARIRRNAMARELQQALDRDEAEEAELDAWATFESDDSLEPARETATWGAEEAVVRQAGRAEAEADTAMVTAAVDRPVLFADVFDLVPPTGQAVAVAGPAGGAALPRPTHLPEIVPARTDRMAWIAAKVQELEHRHPALAGRLHLA